MAEVASNILERNTAKVLGWETVTGSAKLEITPTKGFDKMLILVTESANTANITCKLNAGTYWAAKELTFTAEKNKTTAFPVNDMARFATHVASTPSNKDDIIKLSVTGTGTIAVIELP